MSWFWWLSPPVIAGAAAALWAWWRGRPARIPGPHRAMTEYARYLRAFDGERPAGTDPDRPTADRSYR